MFIIVLSQSSSLPVIHQSQKEALVDGRNNSSPFTGHSRETIVDTIQVSPGVVISTLVVVGNVVVKQEEGILLPSSCPQQMSQHHQQVFVTEHDTLTSLHEVV